MKKEDFKEGLKDMKYVKGKAPVFHIPPYYTKSGKSWVKIGE